MGARAAGGGYHCKQGSAHWEEGQHCKQGTAAWWVPPARGKGARDMVHPAHGAPSTARSSQARPRGCLAWGGMGACEGMGAWGGIWGHRSPVDGERKGSRGNYGPGWVSWGPRLQRQCPLVCPPWASLCERVPAGGVHGKRSSAGCSHRYGPSCSQYGRRTCGGGGQGAPSCSAGAAAMQLCPHPVCSGHVPSRALGLSSEPTQPLIGACSGLH